MDRGQLTQKQLIFLSIYYIFGTLFVTLPRVMAEKSQHTGWLCILLAMALFAGYAYFLTRVLVMMNKVEIIPLLHSFMGKWVGRPISLLLVLVPTLFYSAYVARLVTELFSTLVLPETPIELIIAMILILRYWMVSGGIRSIGLFVEVVLPGVALVLILMILMSVQQAELDRILPLFDTGVMGVFRGTLAVTAPFLEIGILLFVGGRIRNVQQSYRSLLWVNGAVGMLFLITYWLVLGNFGTAFTRHLAFPTIEMVRNISFAQFIEHIESVFLAMWVLLNLTKGSFTFYASCIGFQSWIGLDTYRSLMLPLSVIIFYMAMIPQNLVQAVFRFEAFSGLIYPFYGFAFIVLLYAGLIVRNRKGKGRKAA